MAPTIVMKDGAPVLAIGSPGGSRIIGYVAEAIVAHIDWGMDVQQAVSVPHMVNRFGTYDLEEGTDAGVVDGDHVDAGHIRACFEEVLAIATEIESRWIEAASVGIVA